MTSHRYAQHKHHTGLTNKVRRLEYSFLNMIATRGKALMGFSLAVFFVNIPAISFSRLCVVTLLRCLSVTRTDRFRARGSLFLWVLRQGFLFPIDIEGHQLGAESQASLYLEPLIRLSVDAFHNLDNHHRCLSIALVALMRFSWVLLSMFD